MSLLNLTQKINFVQSVEYSFLKLISIIHLKMMIQMLKNFQKNSKKNKPPPQINLEIRLR